MIFKNTNSFFGKNGFLLVAAAWLLTISFIIDNYWSGVATTTSVQKAIQRNIIKTEKNLERFYKDSVLINKLIKGRYSEKQLEELVEKKFFIFIYGASSFYEKHPIFWNTQVIQPYAGILSEPDGTTFRRLINGWYIINKKKYQAGDGRQCARWLANPRHWPTDGRSLR